MKQGIVFESGTKTVSEIEIAGILWYARPLSLLFLRIGAVTVIFSIGFLAWLWWPLWQAEKEYRDNKVAVVVENEVLPQQTAVAAEKNLDYEIIIPKIGARSKVIAGVDPFDKSEYSEALKSGVAEALGLAHPGEAGTTFLFAHSVGNRLDFARYNAVFYLLDKLTDDDKIYINYHGKYFEYQVETKEILSAGDLRYFEDQKEEEQLVLQTCYPPGTTWKRLIVLAKRV